MPRLAANLSMLFTELPFMDRFAAAARAGFKGVEFLFPYAFDLERMADEVRATGLAVVLHNLPAGDWERGERGIACHPDRVGEFQDGVGKAIEAAKILGVRQLNCLAGKAPAGVAAERLRSTLVGNLSFAATALASAGIRLIVEPINSFDIPGFYLHGTQQALDIIDEARSDNLFLQYDVYHMQRMEGELAGTIEALLPVIKHIQIADNPGRGEPGTGEINYAYLLKRIDELGYDGWIGCEYKPRTTTLDGLRWIEEIVVTQ